MAHMYSLSWTALPGRAVISLTGPDAESFLQGLVSNDIAPAFRDQVVWAAFLTPQGKFRHEFFLYPDGHDGLLIECESGARLMDLGRSLRKYVLRADVKLGLRQDLFVYALWGAGSADLLGREGQRIVPVDQGVLALDPRLPAMGARLVAPEKVALSYLAEIGVAPAPFGDWDRHRVLLGIPDGARDLQPDKAILLESGFEELNGLDWKKGCYMGQELTARTKYRGLVKKRLMPVKLEGGVPEEGTQVLTDESRDAGTLFSVVGDYGLALLRLAAVEAQTALHVGSTVLTPLLPDWHIRQED